MVNSMCYFLFLLIVPLMSGGVKEDGVEGIGYKYFLTKK